MRLKVGVRRHGDRRVLPRPGQARAVHDGLGDALRARPARGRPGRRRAAGAAGLPAQRLRACCRGCSSAPATRDRGSITALYTVLVAGDDMEEPIADEVRGILDGHIILSRELGAREPLARDRRPALALARDDQHRRRRRTEAPRASCASCWPPTSSSATSSCWAPTSRAAIRAPTRRIAKIDAINAFLRQRTDETRAVRGHPPRLLSLV